MKKIIWSLFGLISFAHASSPIGNWKTIDDVTGEPKSIVQIVESSQHSLNGTVIKLFHDSNKRCVKCTGKEHDQPVLGMLVMQGLTQDKDHPAIWTGGQILDPKNGKRYQCQLRLSEDNRQLTLRGYIGTPLFGRSQTWNRE